jgi:Gnt-I system high-affinity gluconate transporter
MAWVLVAILLLVVLIGWAKLHPFLAFLLTSIFAGIVLGLPAAEVPRSIEKGIGGTLGPLVIIVVMGAMFGKLIAQSGAAQKIASVLVRRSGPRYITWAMMLTGFIAGIPLFYNVGFVLLVPLVFSVAFYSKLPSTYVGIPLLAALSTTHGFLPPHPSPTAMVPMLGATLSTTLLYGLVVAVPAVILAGPVFARTFRDAEARLPELFVPQDMPADRLPGAWNSFATALLPVVLIAASAALPASGSAEAKHSIVGLLADPSVLMLIALLVATWTLGLGRGQSMRELMESYAGAVKDIAVILLIIAGAGALKQVLVDAGVGGQISAALQGMNVNPLLLGWLIATAIRICLGSATVAGLTAAGIVAPLVAATGADPNLMVLAIGAGSLMLSHVNDSGFWMYKEYFNLSLKQTLLSWTLMEGIIGVTGLLGVLALDTFL